MSERSIRDVETVLRLPRQILSFMIIFASILLTIFVAVETGEIVLPSSIIRYNNLLVELYLEAEEWELIHFIEINIESTELDPNLWELYKAQVWNNYMKAPDQYWAREHSPGQPLEGIFLNRGGEFHAILRDRSKYLAEEQPSQLAFLVSELGNQTRIAGEYLKAGKDSEVNVVLQDLYETLGKPSYLPLRIYDDFLVQERSGLSSPPRYKLVVYDSFRRTSDSSLVDIGQEILLDRSEDPLLRLMAAHYLSRQGGVNFAEQLFELIDESRNSGCWVQGPLCGSPEEVIFQRELLRILGGAVSEEGERLEKETMEGQ